MSANPLEIAKRLIERESESAPELDSATAVLSALTHISSDLSRYLGADGSRALILRAVSKATNQHPALKDIALGENPDLPFEGLLDAIQKRGATAITEGLRTTIVELVALLDQLVGTDLVMKMIAQEPADTVWQERLRRRNE